jgi:hypothetical protein
VIVAAPAAVDSGCGYPESCSDAIQITAEKIPRHQVTGGRHGASSGQADRVRRENAGMADANAFRRWTLHA